MKATGVAETRRLNQLRVTATAISDRARIAQALRGARVLSSCGEAVIQDLGARSRFARLRKDRSVVEQGLVWPYLGIVASGALQAVLAGESGREYSLFDALPGDVFGEISFLDRGTTVLRYVAATDSTAVVLIPADRVRSECAVNPVLAAALSEAATKRTRTILDRFASHLALPATNRVANLLLEIAENERRGSGRALSDYTQVQLARMAGTTVREVVQRILSGFQAAGILQLERGRVILLDRAHLAQESQEVARATPATNRSTSRPTSDRG